jgi:predicted phosphodiesterase
MNGGIPMPRSSPLMTRRRFLHASTAAWPLSAAAAGGEARHLRLGLVADLHKDVIHDADERLRAFVTSMTEAKVDAIVQLGDFCIPKAANRGFLALFDSFPGPRYHVLGNHDTDGGFTRQQTMAFWGMKAPYHSFDLGGFHFVILDGNDRPDGWQGGYPSHLAAEQVAWLKQDLAATTLATFVFSHQSLERPDCIDNQQEVRAVIEGARTSGGQPKVAACFNGHWHIDHAREIAGVPYLHINSASYYWLGETYRHQVLGGPLAREFPQVALTAPYTRPLFTTLDIDPAVGVFRVAPCESDWLGPSPAELGFRSAKIDLASVRPGISAREGKLPG